MTIKYHILINNLQQIKLV